MRARRRARAASRTMTVRCYRFHSPGARDKKKPGGHAHPYVSARRCAGRSHDAHFGIALSRPLRHALVDVLGFLTRGVPSAAGRQNLFSCEARGGLLAIESTARLLCWTGLYPIRYDPRARSRCESLSECVRGGLKGSTREASVRTPPMRRVRPRRLYLCFLRPDQTSSPNPTAPMPCGKKRKRHKIATHKRKKRLRKNRHKKKNR